MASYLKLKWPRPGDLWEHAVPSCVIDLFRKFQKHSTIPLFPKEVKGVSFFEVDARLRSIIALY